MPTSLRQQIIENVKTQLKTILVGNGFNSNLGQNVFDWKTSAWGQNEMPGLSVEDGSHNTQSWTLGKPGTGKVQQTINLEIFIKVESGTTPAETLRGMIADVIQAIGNNFTFGLTNVWTEQDQDAALLVQEKNVISGARLGFKVHYISGVLNPYQ